MRKMVYIVLAATGLMMAGLIFAGCNVLPDKADKAELTGISLTQNHMNFGSCYSFYLREENGKLLFDAEVRFEEEPYTIILEGCEADSEYLDKLKNISKEYGVADYVNKYKKKPVLFETSDKTVNKTTVYFSDGTSKTADSKNEHIDILYDFFFDLAKKNADKSVYVKE